MDRAETKKMVRLKKWQPKNTVYSIIFKRLNKITIFCGLLFIVLALINLPFAYNPELGEITFTISGKPQFGLGANVSFYVFMGLIPVIMGLIFILFSIFTGGRIALFILEDGKCVYLKFGIPKILKDFRVELDLKDTLQQISIGKRHQRFVMWCSVAAIMFLAFLLLDYMNFLNLTFDITTMFFEIKYSVKLMVLFNVIFIIGILLLFTLFPRRLFLLNTSETLLKFDYTELNVEIVKQVLKAPLNLPYIEPFAILSKSVRKEGKIRKSEPVIPENYPDVLKAQIYASYFDHLPLFMILTNIGLFLVVFVPNLLPNFFLGSFTFRIEYFITIAAFYSFIRTLQNYWYTDQQIQSKNNSLLVKRSNKIFGDSVEYFANIDKIERNFTPRKPHFLEYALLFFPILEIVWLMTNMISFPIYFFTQNIYTWLYFTVIAGIFFFTVVEYICPRPKLSITPKTQSKKNGKSELFAIYFPESPVFKLPPFKEAIKRKNFFKNSLMGFLLILIPLAIGIIWVLLSILGLLPPISETIF